MKSIWLGAFAAVAVACGSEASSDDLFQKPGTGGSAQGGSGASTGGSVGSAGSGASNGGFGGVGGLGGVSGIGGNGAGGNGAGGNGAGGIGGSNSGGDGGVFGSGGATDAAPDAPTSDGSNPGGAGGSMGVGGSSNPSSSVDCGGSPCDVTQGGVCCRSVGGGFGGGPFGGFGGSGFGGSGFGGSGGASTTCSSTGGCNNNSTRIFCDGPEDCAASSACCASYQNIGPTIFYSELVCRPAGECAGPGRRIVCAPGTADPCPNGGNCQQSTALPNGYEVCG